MGLIVRRVRAALHVLELRPHDLKKDARLVVDQEGEAIIETYWESDELAGSKYLLCYKVLPKCFYQLILQELIVENDVTEGELRQFRLSNKGKERLG